MTVSRMLFVLSTGRCGTAYLHKVCRSIPNTVSLHEPPPAFHENSHLSRDDKLKWLSNVKLPYIKNLAQDNYIETSPQFKKWVDLFLELNEIPDVAVLRRPHRDIALSMWRMGYIPARSHVSKKYGIKPDDDVFLHVDNFSYWTDYQLCYWHCLETEARIEKYVPLLKSAGALIAETTLADIRTANGFMQLTHDLQLPEPISERMYDMIGVRINATRPGNDNKWPHGNLDTQEEEIREIFDVEVS